LALDESDILPVSLLVQQKDVQGVVLFGFDPFLVLSFIMISQKSGV